MRTRHVALWLALCSSSLNACGAPALVMDGGDPADGAAIDGAVDSDAPTADVAAQTEGGPSADGGVASCGSCADYSEPAVSGRWRRAVINELSGLAASAIHPGIFWAHNDSGDRARLFAVTLDGVIQGEYAIDNAAANDWEDIAVAPCAGGVGSCIVVGDVGDNPSTRVDVDLYRVREPAVLEPMGALTATRFRVRYPGGPMNCEALVVDRRDGASALLIEKTTRAPRLVRVSLAEAMGGDVMGEELGTIATFSGQLVTAADAHPCASAMLVRTYDALYELRAGAGASLQAMAMGTRAVVSSANELQGEAVAYFADGRGYVTGTEGMNSLISTFRCR
jgi:hypothetical protein